MSPRAAVALLGPGLDLFAGLLRENVEKLRQLARVAGHDSAAIGRIADVLEDAAADVAEAARLARVVGEGA